MERLRWGWWRLCAADLAGEDDVEVLQQGALLLQVGLWQGLGSGLRFWYVRLQQLLKEAVNR